MWYHLPSGPRKLLVCNLCIFVRIIAARCSILFLRLPELRRLAYSWDCMLRWPAKALSFLFREGGHLVGWSLTFCGNFAGKLSMNLKDFARLKPPPLFLMVLQGWFASQFGNNGLTCQIHSMLIKFFLMKMQWDYPSYSDPRK